MVDRRMIPRAGTLVYTRILLGLIAVIHGVSGVIFVDGGGIVQLVRNTMWGELFAVCLMGFGTLMTFAALMEQRGVTKRWCREFSASMLGATWLAVFFHSFEGGIDPLTLFAPLYFGFCAYAWWSEATAQRQKVLAQKARVPHV